MPPIAFRILYNAEEGYEGEALALARRLFAVYDTGIDSLSLVPTAHEQLALYFNEQLVASRQHDGRAPTVADVRELLRREGITVVHRPGPEEGAGYRLTRFVSLLHGSATPLLQTAYPHNTQAFRWGCNDLVTCNVSKELFSALLCPITRQRVVSDIVVIASSIRLRAIFIHLWPKDSYHFVIYRF